MADDLRARLAEALANTPAKFLAEAGHNDALMTFHGKGRGGHDYDGACALCRGEIDTLLDAIMPVLNGVLKNLVSICCHQAYGGPHTMACREYSGPIDHWRVYSVPDVADLTARGLAECTCGVRYPVAGGVCPNAAETRCGSKPEDVP